MLQKCTLLLQDQQHLQESLLITNAKKGRRGEATDSVTWDKGSELPLHPHS